MPYRAAVAWSDEDDCFVARAVELEFCAAHGDSREQALAELEIAMAGWLEVAIDFGDAIPPEVPENTVTESEGVVLLNPKPFGEPKSIVYPRKPKKSAAGNGREKRLFKSRNVK